MMKVSGAIRPEFVLLGLLALCFTVALTPVFGQAQSRLTGTVTDVSNAVIPGAQVTVRNIATGITSSATTNETGT